MSYEGLCTQMSQKHAWVVFFPDFSVTSGGDDAIATQRREAAEALSICSRCPGSQGDNPCLRRALREPHGDGVTGNTVPLERAQMRRPRDWAEKLRIEFLGDPENGVEKVHYKVLMEKYGVSRAQVYKIGSGKSHAPK